MGKNNLLFISLLGIAIILIPFITPHKYYLSLFVIVAIHGLIVLGLTLFMGFAGQISLGHSAFYGIGAYTSGVLTVKFGFPPTVALLIAVVGTSLVALLISFPILRLKGFYLGMVTLGFAEIVYICLNEMINLTGGGTGLSNIPVLSILGFQFDNDTKYYYLVWVLLFGIIVFSLNFLHSRVGRALRGIHYDELAANVMGVNVTLYKIIVFVLSASYAGLGGGLYAHYITFLSPGVFHIMFNVIIIAMVVIGGSGSVWGAILGTFLLTILPEYLVYLQYFQPLTFGLLIILIVTLSPRGLIGLLEKLSAIILALYRQLMH